MKLLFLVSTLPSLVNSFSMNGLVRGSHARVSSVSSALHARPPLDLDDAFEDLKKEIAESCDDSPTADEVASKSKKWVNRYFDLFSGINRDMATSEEEATYNEKELGKQREFANKVIDFAVELGQDLSSLDLDGIQRPSPKNDNQEKNPAGSYDSPLRAVYSPRFSIKDDDKIFQVTLELPGVDIGDVNIELDKKKNVLVVSGRRPSLVSSGDTIPFSETFELGLEVDTERIAANLDKGILTVSAPKQERMESTTQRVPIESGN